MLEQMSESGAKTAANYYGCRGWAANHNVDLWRQTEPVAGDAKYAYWPMGGVWLSAQIYDYYSYTGDTVFAQKQNLSDYDRCGEVLYRLDGAGCGQGYFPYAHIHVTGKYISG